MKFARIALFTALAAVMVLSSCKKKKEEDPIVLKTFSFDNTTSTVVELTWSVKDGSTTHADGETYVDMDIYMSDTTGGSRNMDYGSDNASGTELFTVPTSASSATYYLGVMYYTNEQAPASGSYTIDYTIKAYPTGNVAAAKTFTGTLSGVTSSGSKVYFQMSAVKSANGIVFTELANKFSLTGY